jgi:hypothetical protein
MYEISERLKDYLYLNQRLINNIYSQMPKKNLLETLKYKIGINIKYFEATIENELKNKSDNEKIIMIYNFLKKNNYLKEPSNNFIYTPYDYYCIEKQNFVIISLMNSKIETKYDLNKITFYISLDRTFSKFSTNSPLFLIPDNINNIGMDGSSGYSIFKLLFRDYLKCGEYYLNCLDENLKINFAKDPVSLFKKLECTISDVRCFETLYKKRSILNNNEQNIVYTFGYPIYIASIT